MQKRAMQNEECGEKRDRRAYDNMVIATELHGDVRC